MPVCGNTIWLETLIQYPSRHVKVQVVKTMTDVEKYTRVTGLTYLGPQPAVRIQQAPGMACKHMGDNIARPKVGQNLADLRRLCIPAPALTDMH
jgi:hypothetical protein